MEQNFIENELVILTKHTLDKFLEQDNPAELIALYSFYYYTAKWQKTNIMKCTTDYVAKALFWKVEKVRKIKRQLKDFSLIEDVEYRNDDGLIVGHYIKLNYIFKQLSTPRPNPEGGKIHRVDNGTPNALSTNNINALSTNNINIYCPLADEQCVFDTWNNQKIIVHRVLDKQIGQAIKTAIKTYSVAKINEYIVRYKQVLDDQQYFYKYKWTLKEFLTRRDGISSFADDGGKWVNYLAYKDKKVNKNGLQPIYDNSEGGL